MTDNKKPVIYFIGTTKETENIVTRIDVSYNGEPYTMTVDKNNKIRPVNLYLTKNKFCVSYDIEKIINIKSYLKSILTEAKYREIFY